MVDWKKAVSSLTPKIHVNLRGTLVATISGRKPDVLKVWRRFSPSKSLFDTYHVLKFRRSPTYPNAHTLRERYVYRDHCADSPQQQNIQCWAKEPSWSNHSLFKNPVETFRLTISDGRWYNKSRNNRTALPWRSSKRSANIAYHGSQIFRQSPSRSARPKPYEFNWFPVFQIFKHRGSRQHRRKHLPIPFNIRNPDESLNISFVLGCFAFNPLPNV